MAEGKVEHWERKVVALLEQRWKLIVLLVWLGFCGWFVFQKWSDIRWFGLGDTDDNMRIMQVRALLHGQGWFDLRQLSDEPAHRREHPLVTTGRPADCRADPPAPAHPGRARGGALGGRDRANAALPAAALLDRVDGAAADPSAGLSAGAAGPVLRRIDQRHVHARTDRPSRLAAGVACAFHRRNSRLAKAARRPLARRGKRTFADHRAGNDHLPGARRRGDGPAVGCRP